MRWAIELKSTIRVHVISNDKNGKRIIWLRETVQTRLQKRCSCWRIKVLNRECVKVSAWPPQLYVIWLNGIHCLGKGNVFSDGKLLHRNRKIYSTSSNANIIVIYGHNRCWINRGWDLQHFFKFKIPKFKNILRLTACWRNKKKDVSQISQLWSRKLQN